MGRKYSEIKHKLSPKQLEEAKAKAAILADMLAPISPGEVLRTEFMVPRRLSVKKLAVVLRLPTTEVAAILRGERSISKRTARCLGRFFGTPTEFWSNLQTEFDLRSKK